MKRLASIVSGAFLLFVGGASAADRPFNIAPFARRCCLEDQFRLQVAFDYAENERAGPNAERAPDGRYIYGLQWAEERDIEQVLLHFEASPEPTKFAVQYWFRNWPYPPPHMPTIEDPVDDPWQGRWLTASSTTHCERGDCTVGFKPLTVSENPLAKNLPNLEYRRTLKLRLVFTEDPRLKGVEVFSGSTERPLQLRVQLGAGDSTPHEWNGSIRVYNGRLSRMRLWQGASADSVQQNGFSVKTGGTPKGLLLDLVTAEPSLPGSEDVSVVTLDAGDRTFSFATADTVRGPVYVPDSHVYVALASDPKNFSPSLLKPGAEIRARLPGEPEQSYERAWREIPPLDPVERQGGRLYLPLAADASWQKFAFEWGGNIAISKQGTKAKGRELARLEWPGDRITWRIGTGAQPGYRPLSKDSTLRVLEDDLPIAIAAWKSAGIDYTEEGLATLLSGPLSPDDPERSEETPAVLMLKMTARNAGSSAAVAHIWLGVSPAEQTTFNGGELLAGGGELVRARLKLPGGARAAATTVPDGDRKLQGLHVEIPLAARSQQDLFHATEPLADWVLNDWEDNATMSVPLGLFVHGWVDEKYWFSRGGIVFQANLQNPILVYLRRNEIPAAVRNLYNDFVACYYPTVNVFTEEFRQWKSPSGPFYKSSDEAKFVNRLRDSLVREDSDVLWLAGGTPRRWLAPGQEIDVRQAPTYFGPVSYRLKAGAVGIDAQVQLPTRNPYHTAWLVVRAPAGKRIASVTIDGRLWTRFDAANDRIQLPIESQPIQVEVKF